jgi:hypothetical protein
MVRALLLSHWIGLAHDKWRDSARRRPRAVEIDVLRELAGRLQAKNDLLRARLERLGSAHRPRYRAWERLRILWPPGFDSPDVPYASAATAGSDWPVTRWLS